VGVASASFRDGRTTVGACRAGLSFQFPVGKVSAA
jgi:hypothetical protein